MNKDRYQDKYNEIFQELKEERMDWSFDDFLQKTEETPIVPLNTPKKPGLPKWFWMAASVILVFSVCGLLFIEDWKDREKLVQSEILKQKDLFIEENNLEENRVAFNSLEDSLKSGVKDSIFQDSVDSYSERNVLDEILPRKGRFKKKYKEVFVNNSPESLSIADSTKYNANYVIVNGKKIEDMEEAIEVTKYSFQMLSNNVNRALVQTKSSEEDEY